MHIDHYFRFVYFVPVLRWRVWRKYQAALDVFDALIDPLPQPELPAGVLRVPLDRLSCVAITDPQIFTHPTAE
ncbi:MAG: hypothetical protein GDA50_04110 [Alphaproteobacteria bacterium GM202ARS2]|nr:hypothetical protein [Alphaproteobacteria bacterium GM202ARS2]